MPLFDYTCETCRQTFEVLVLPGRDDGAPRCPACGSQRTVRRTVARIAVGSARTSAQPAVAPCARCGDPRGPGACALD